MYIHEYIYNHRYILTYIKTFTHVCVTTFFLKNHFEKDDGGRRERKFIWNSIKKIYISNADGSISIIMLKNENDYRKPVLMNKEQISMRMLMSVMMITKANQQARIPTPRADKETWTKTANEDNAIRSSSNSSAEPHLEPPSRKCIAASTSYQHLNNDSASALFLNLTPRPPNARLPLPPPPSPYACLPRACS